MKVLIIPKIIEPYKKQIEFSIENRLLIFLKKCFKKCLIDIAYNLNYQKRYDLIILSGGNTIISHSTKKKDKQRAKLDEFFLRQAKLNEIPIFGICHGAHFIAKKFNMNFQVDNNHVGSHPIKNVSKFNIKFKNVNSFHNLKIKYKSLKSIENLLLAKDKSIECFRIKNKKIGGIIWHPEREIKKTREQIMFFRKFYSYIK